MDSISLINQRLQKLPLALQEEVLQFIDYLFFRSKPAEPGAIIPDLKTKEQKPASFAWAGALKGMDEGLSSVEWQRKISELMIADATSSPLQ